MKSILPVLLIFLSTLCNAQINDCQDAEVVCSSADLAFNPQGPGLDDYADPDNDEGCIVDLEQNSAWYYFQIDPLAPPNLELGFIIFPKGGLGEDYDWALYGPDVPCGNLGSPIRCSSSSAACGFCPETGMGMGTTDVTEGPGTGDGFVSTLIVQPGQGFYLMIDNWQGTDNGFVLTWTHSAAPFLNCNAAPPCALNAIAGPDLNACEGDDTPLQLNGSTTGNQGAVTYSWSGTNGGTNFLDDPNIQSPTLSIPIDFNGVITFTLTVVEDTCISEDQLDVTVNPLPVITITGVGPFCENNPPQTLTANPPGGVWSGAATGNTFNPATNGPGIHTVTYTYTDVNDCSATESIDIEVNAIPDVTIDPTPASFCENDGSVLLTAEGSGGAGGYSYTWNTPGGSGTDDFYNAAIGGQYIVSVSDNNGCTNTTSTTVTVLVNPEAEIIDPGPICGALEYFTLTATPAGGFFEGTIISPDGELYPNTTTPGTYAITYNYIDSYGCEDSDIENITIIPTPTAFAENNGALCAGEPILLYGETDGTGSEILYSWIGPNGYVSNLQNPSNATIGGFYTLEVTIDGCSSLPVNTFVQVIDAPEANASNSGPYCSGQTILLFGTTNATGSNIVYAWSGPNGYTSDLQNPANATVAGIYSLVVTVGSCTSQISSTQVVFNQPPTAIATNDGPYCAGEIINLFGSTNSSGTVINYAWNGPNGYNSTAQNPSGGLQPGTYNLIVTVDGCNSIANTTSVVINQLPLPVITGATSFCTGNSTTLDAGNYSSFLWNNSSTSQTVTANASGVYSVTITDINGCTGNTSLTVIETPSLSPVITGDLDFCEGSGTVLDAGNGFASYQWSTGETSQSIVVTTDGNFGVLVTDSDACSGSTNVTTIVNSNPAVVVGGSTTFCIGGSSILDAGANYQQYNWSNGATSQTINVSIPGTYSVDIVDLNGCTGSASVSIQESTSLQPVITGNTSFCKGSNSVLNAGSGFATYNWSDGSTSQNLVVNTSGIYSVTVSDGQSCFGESSVTVIEVLPPSATLQTQISLCNTQAGGSVIDLYDLVLSGDSNGTWEDTDQSGAVGLFNNLDFNNIPAGDYHFNYSTNSATQPCQEVTYEIIITVIDCACPDVFFFNAPSLCNGGDILDLTTIENTEETGAWKIFQTPPGNNPVSLNGATFDATNRDPGEYIIQFELQDQPPPGCVAQFFVTINVDSQVDAGVAMPPVSYCFNDVDNVVLLDLISGEDLNGVWNEVSVVPSQGNAFDEINGLFDIKDQLPGTFLFEYSIDANGACPADETSVTVIINSLPVVTIADFGILDCTITSQNLDATGSSFGADFDIVWAGPGIVLNGNENTLEPTIDDPGIYVLTITNELTGCENSAQITIEENVNTPTGALIISDDPKCFGDENAFIHVNQVIGGELPIQFSLNGAPFTLNNLFNQLPAGNYELELNDANGCKWDTTITLTTPVEVAIDLGEDIELDFGETANVQANVSIPSAQIDTIIWSPVDLLQCVDMFCFEGIVNTFNTVTLTATVTDLNGCKASDDIQIRVIIDRKIFIPTAFSPNDDGINDIFYIFGREHQIRNIKRFAIYNRWGDVIHEAHNFAPNDPAKGWNGHFRNEVLNPGVFVYTAEIEYLDGLIEVLTGDITLMK